jgi:hypothetical protein
MNRNPLAQLPEHRQFGSTTIEVADDEFFNGFQVGSLLWRVAPATTELTDTAIYSFVCSILQEETTEGYKAGAISGWFASLYGYHLPAPIFLPQPPVAEFITQERQ